MIDETSRREGYPGTGPSEDRKGRSKSRRALAGLVAIGLFATATARAQSGPAPKRPGAVQPTAVPDLGDLPRTVPEVGEAVKSFEKRDVEACLQQLARAVKAHPELPPPHALLAKMALLNNQAGIVRPALERAVAEDGQHPEVYLLLGNLALMEGRITDGAVHFEKRRALAVLPRWTAEQRKRFERLCHQGDAFVAESRGDWKAARASLAAWLEQEPANARRGIAWDGRSSASDNMIRRTRS